MPRIAHNTMRVSLLSRSPLILCLILVSPSLQAGEVKEADVTAAVETWVRHVTADARPDAVVKRLVPHVAGDRTVGYIAHLAGGGYCLCGADHLVLPVYLYSPQGTYDPENPGNQYILWEIGARLVSLEQALKDQDAAGRYQAALTDRAAFWQELIARRIPEKRGGRDGRDDPDMMELHLTCTWGQGSPYNDECPELTPGADEHVVVGCVATAMSQIMYYWQWPETGQGADNWDYDFRWSSTWHELPLVSDPNIPPKFSGRLEWHPSRMLRMSGYWDGSIYDKARDVSSGSDYRWTLELLYNSLTPETTNNSANFGATTYDWSIMEDVHSDSSPAPGDAEVAQLGYHAGIAVHMNWGLWESGAFTSDVDDVFEDHFRYDPDTMYWTPHNIYTMTWEIQWLRPLELGGYNPDGGGHEWVVYGYNTGTDPDREFKMNFGWRGDGDGWYSCDSINPPDHGPYTNLAHVTNIAPESVVRFVGSGDPGDGGPADPYQDIDEALLEAPNGATLIFRAGTTHTFTGEIDRPCTLRGYDVVIQGE